MNATRTHRYMNTLYLPRVLREILNKETILLFTVNLDRPLLLGLGLPEVARQIVSWSVALRERDTEDEEKAE